MMGSDAVADDSEKYIKEIDRPNIKNKSEKRIETLKGELAELGEKLGKKVAGTGADTCIHKLPRHQRGHLRSAATAIGTTQRISCGA